MFSVLYSDLGKEFASGTATADRIVIITSVSASRGLHSEQGPSTRLAGRDLLLNIWQPDS